MRFEAVEVGGGGGGGGWGGGGGGGRPKGAIMISPARHTDQAGFGAPRPQRVIWPAGAGRRGGSGGTPAGGGWGDARRLYERCPGEWGGGRGGGAGTGGLGIAGIDGLGFWGSGWATGGAGRARAPVAWAAVPAVSGVTTGRSGGSVWERLPVAGGPRPGPGWVKERGHHRPRSGRSARPGGEYGPAGRPGAGPGRCCAPAAREMAAPPAAWAASAARPALRRWRPCRRPQTARSERRPGRSSVYSLGCALSQAAALVGEARASQASWITSVNSGKASSPIRLARTSTDGWPSKCGVVKNGDVWS